MGMAISRIAEYEMLQRVSWTVLVRDFVGNYRLHTIDLHPFATGGEVGLALQVELMKDIPTPALWLSKWVLLRNPVVMIKPKKDVSLASATIMKRDELIIAALQFVLDVFSHNSEAQDTAPRGGVFDLDIAVDPASMNHFLTTAMHDPAKVTTAAVVDNFPQLSSTSPEGEAQLVVLSFRTNKKAIAIAATIETVLILLVGLVVGLAKQDKVIALSIILPALFVVLVLKALAWKQSN